MRLSAVEVVAKNKKNKSAWAKTPPVVGAVVIPAKPNTVSPEAGAPLCVVREESEIEAMLDRQIEAVGLPMPIRNMRFIDGRKLELDFGWPDLRLGVEVEGEVHRIKERFHSDIEKHALAILNGWVVMRVDGRSIRSGKAIEWLKELFANYVPEAPMKK